jgi:hypothetical protein
MTDQQTLVSAAAEPGFAMRVLSDGECEVVSGGLAEPEDEGDDEHWDGRFIQRRYLLSDETGEEIVITAVLHNDGGGYCPTDSGWIPNFIENLFDGDKFYFSGDGPFKYAMRGDHGTLCLYDRDGNLFGGYVGATSTDSYVMALTFTTNATTGDVSVMILPPGGGISQSSGTTGTSTSVTLFLARAGQ